MPQPHPHCSAHEPPRCTRRPQHSGASKRDGTTKRTAASLRGKQERQDCCQYLFVKCCFFQFNEVLLKIMQENIREPRVMDSIRLKRSLIFCEFKAINLGEAFVFLPPKNIFASFCKAELTSSHHKDTACCIFCLQQNEIMVLYTGITILSYTSRA